MKAVAVIGFSGSGKTTIVEKVVGELKSRGYSVATVKHVHGAKRIDLADKDTWRHINAGADLAIALSDSETLKVKPEKTELWRVLWKLSSYDYVVLEGFKKSFYGAKIAVANSVVDAEKLFNSLVIAFVGRLASDMKELKGIPVVDLENVDFLVDLIEEKAFMPPAGVNCRKCRYSSCADLAAAILRGEAAVDECVFMKKTGVELMVNGIEVKLNPFVSLVFKNVILGLVNSLKGVENPREIEVKIKLV